MKIHHPTTRPRKRRADEAAAPTAERAATPAQSLAVLRRPEASPAARSAALADLQRTLGNAAVERMVGGAVLRSAQDVQRKGVKKKKKRREPGETVIGATVYSSYAIDAATLAEAAQAIRGRKEAGLAEWNPQLSYKDVDGVITEAKVTATPTVTLPKWPGAAKAGKAAQAEWSRFSQALAEHEQGHVDLVHQHLGGLGAKLVGKTVAEAQAAFDAATTALQAASDQYDAKTDHGRNTGTVIELAVDE
jgi:predicted secreted Zn-dependent protease